MAAGLARAQITFLVDADGILHVTAVEKTSGAEAKVDVKPSYGLSDEEVERMLIDSFEHAEEDKRLRNLLTERMEAERLLAGTQTAMRDDATLLESDVREAMERAIAGLEAARRGEDATAIHAAAEALDEAARPFAEARMNRSIERAAKGRRIDELERGF